MRRDQGMPIDRGWAWMVVVGAHIIQFSMVGCIKSLGIMFVEFREAFGVNAATCSLTNAVIYGGMAITSPLSTVLGERLGYRTVVISGGLCAATGAFLAAFAQNITFVIVVFGGLMAVAYGFLFTPTAIMVGRYFDRRRSLANGLAFAGASTGTLVLPIVMRYVTDVYGFRGTLMILAGVLLHVVVAGALFRPLSFFTRHRKPHPVQTPPKLVSHKGSEEHASTLKRVISLTTPPCEKEPPPPPPLAIPEVYNELTIPLSEKEPPPLTIAEVCSEPLLSASIPVVFGSQLGLYTSRIEYSSTHDLPDASSDEECVMDDKQFIQKNQTKSTTKSRLDFTIFLNILYLSYLVSTAANNAAYMNNYLYIPAYVQESGSSKHVASMLLALSGICDLLCRLFWGWLADTNLIRRSHLVACCLFVVSITNVVPTFFPSIYTVSVQVLALGIFGSCYPCLICVVLIDYMGLDRLPGALGFSAMIMALFNTGMTPLLGYIRDQTGGYEWVFRITGFFFFIGALLLLADPVIRNIQKDSADRRRREQPLPNLVLTDESFNSLS